VAYFIGILEANILASFAVSFTLTSLLMCLWKASRPSVFGKRKETPIALAKWSCDSREKHPKSCVRLFFGASADGADAP
jgi:hypothetical protein